MKLHNAELLGLKHTSIVCPLADRPICQSCGRKLKLVTHTVYLNGVLRNLSLSRDKLTDAIAWSRFEGPTEEPTEVAIWSGQYGGYGRDEKDVPLFCTHECALSFACVQYRGGMRIRFHGELLSRP